MLFECLHCIWLLMMCFLFCFSRPYLESVHPQCQAVMSDSAVHLSYQLLSLAFANEACLEKLPCTNTVLKQHRPMSVFIYTALTDLSVRNLIDLEWCMYTGYIQLIMTNNCVYSFRDRLKRCVVGDRSVWGLYLEHAFSTVLKYQVQ